MEYSDEQPRDDNGQWAAFDASNGTREAASDNPAEMKKFKKEKLKKHIALLNERMLSGGIGKKERRLIEKRVENMSGEILSLMD